MSSKKDWRSTAESVEATPEIDRIPTLTDIVETNESTLPAETLDALQAELSVRVLNLAEELLHSASREIEAILLERVCDTLRAQLPELIDEALRERLQRNG
jgi:hypothetical protein